MDAIPQLNYKLPCFEGPLDLLLNLISKNKINIYDIQISVLLEQYMEQIKIMQENQMDIASEFLTMASRLVYIKSAMLLPKHEEEVEELKKELTGQLLEYQVCREIAEKMSHIYDFDTFFKEASPVEFDLTYNRKHDPQDIVKGYIDAVGRDKRKLPPPESAFSGIVQKPVISVSSRIITVMRKLWHGKRIKYSELFTAVGQRSELVATFLAVLELVKGKRVRVEGEGDDAQVYMLEDKK